MKTPIILFLFLLAQPLIADWRQEERKIDYLLDQIAKLDGMFVRNGTEHPPEKAVEHLRMKMNRAMNSWFAPKKETWTAELFIQKLASQSLLTGKPYQIKFHDGRTVNSGVWLLKKLKQYPRSRQSAP
jgi:hypothetical protein